MSEHRNLDLCLCTVIDKTDAVHSAVGRKKVIGLSGKSIGTLTNSVADKIVDNTARTRWSDMPFIFQINIEKSEDSPKNFLFPDIGGRMTVLFERIERDVDARLYFPMGQPILAKGVLVDINNLNSTCRQFFNETDIPDGYYLDPWVNESAASWL